MKKSSVGGHVLLTTGLCLVFLSPSWGEENPWKERIVRVTGNGQATAPPDQARMEFEVTTESQKLEEASSQAKARMAEVLKAIKAHGVPERDIQTIRYGVQPKYRYDKDGGEAKQVGFTVSNRLRVTIKNLDQVGKILEAVTKAGISQVDGPSFGFADPSKLEVLALKDAMKDARNKAEALAQSADASLGKVLSIQSSSASAPGPRPMMMSMANKAAADIPVERGESEVTAQVEVVFSLK